MSDNDTNQRSPAPARPPADPPRHGPSGLLAWLPWVAAAGFAVLAGLLAQTYLAARTEVILLRDEARLARLETRTLQQRLEAERILAARRLADGISHEPRAEKLKCFLLTPPDGTTAPAAGAAIWDSAQQEGELVLGGLAPLSGDKVYQLWLYDPKSRDPVSAAVFTVPPDAGGTRISFRPVRPVSEPASLTLTIERQGGAPRAEGPLVLGSR